MPYKLPISISQEEFDSIISITKKPHHKLAFVLGFCSGMRISEIVNLQPVDVDLNNKSIFIRSGKGERDRVVPLPKGFGEKSIKLLPIKCGARALEIVFKKCLIKANITKPGLHFHSLRHGFATHALNNNIPINQVQLLLGHSNVATTSIYIRANPKDALKSYEEMF
jgi:integrase/recombinase XerD